LLQAHVRAHNVNGWGGYSQVNTAGAFVQSVPIKMAAPTENAATTIDTI